MAEISIIVPVYQAEKTIGVCVESILSQTFLDFELILINDGSTDKSGDICDNYTKKDSRIKVFHQENKGVSATRNRGISLAEGKYIMFCDSDDYVDPHWCEYMHKLIFDNPNAFCTCDTYKIAMNEKCDFKAEEMQINHSIQNYFNLWKAGLSAYSVTKIYQKAILKNNSILFDENRRISEDVEFNIKYFQKCEKIIAITNKLYYYQNNPQSAMNSITTDFFQRYQFPFNIRLPLIQKENIGVYCDEWFYCFLIMFKDVLKKGDWGYIKKLKYNQIILNSDEFQYVLSNMSGKNESPIVIKILKTNNYYLYWLFEKVVTIKNKLTNR